MNDRQTYFWTPTAYGGPDEPRIPVPRPIPRPIPRTFATRTPPNSVQSPLRQATRTPPEFRHLVPMFGSRRSFFPRASPSPVHYLPKVKLFLDVREPNAFICPICQEPFSMLAIVTDLQCNHLIHHNCLVEWIFQHNSCPICRGTTRRIASIWRAGWSATRTR